jgi:hypothetical protein
MFFADGTICPTCGRRASLLLRDAEHSSGVRFDVIESLKTALRIKIEEHDCCAEDNIELRKELEFQRNAHAMAQQAMLEQGEQLAACEKERDQHHRKLIAESALCESWADEAASLRTQLAAVTKERDILQSVVTSDHQDLIDVMKERDEWKSSALNGGNAAYLRERVKDLEFSCHGLEAVLKGFQQKLAACEKEWGALLRDQDQFKGRSEK